MNNEQIKEKIGLYKTLIALFWTGFIIISGGAYKLYHSNEIKLFYLVVICGMILIIGFSGLVMRIRYWISKMENKKNG